jgi:hypothetical protein
MWDYGEKREMKSFTFLDSHRIEVRGAFKPPKNPRFNSYPAKICLLIRSSQWSRGDFASIE